MPQYFAAVTLEVLGEHGSTFKPITRLVQLLRTWDFECFLTFLHDLIEELAAQPRYLLQGREKDPLFGLIAKRRDVIMTDFSSVGGRECLDTAAHPQQFYTIVDTIASAYNSGLHPHTVYDKADIRDPQAAMVCAATHCLAPLLFNTTSSPHRHAILSLRDIDVPRSTIIEAISPQIARTPPHSGTCPARTRPPRALGLAY